MDCDLTRSLLLIGPSNRSMEDTSALELHLKGCASCSAYAGRETRFDESLHRAMVNVPVPTGLNEQLLRAAFAKRGAAFRRTIYKAINLAAIVVLSVLIANGVSWRLRPAPDGQTWVDQAETDRDFRHVVVSEWLAAKGLPDSMPPGFDFDFNFNVDYNIVELHGRTVPMVLFSRGEDFAKVYIVQESKLDLSKMTSTQSSRTVLEIVPHPTRKDIKYVIIRSEDISRLLKQQINNRPA